MKKLRQGQTVYMVDRGMMYEPPRPSVIKLFLYSQKQELPPWGCIIDKMPVNHLNDLISLDLAKVTLSRRKAELELKQLIYFIKR